MCRRFQSAIVVAWVFTIPLSAQTENVPLSHHYGFRSPEIYKLDPRLENMLAKDVNHDGKLDLVIVNNAKNRIDLLVQRGEGDEPVPSSGSDVNELPSDARLKHVKLPVSRTVSALSVADINNDGRQDLVYLADPSGLYTQYQDESGSFQPGQSFEIDDVQLTAWSVDAGDLNGDGLNDVVFLGKRNIYLSYQNANGRLGQPKKFRLTVGKASLVRIVDLDGDGLNDVVHLTDDEEFPCRARFQNSEHGLGPERRLITDPPRGVSYANVDGKPGEEILLVSNRTGRFEVYSLRQAQDKISEPAVGQLVTYPFEKGTDNSDADLVLADINGDGKEDVVVGDSQGAQLFAYIQEETGLVMARPYPGLFGTSQLRAKDVDGDKKAELFSLSDREKVIGVSRYETGRLTFPRPLPTRDEPLAMVFLPSSNKLAYVSRGRENGSSKTVYYLRILEPEDKGAGWSQAKVNGKEELALDLDNKPSQLRVADVNADGNHDLVLFYLFQAPTILLGKGGDAFEQAPKLNQQALGTLSPSALYAGPLNGEQKVLIGQRNFARHMQMRPDGRWATLDQFNASQATGDVTGVQIIDLDADGVDEIALFDRNSSSVVFLKRDDGVYRRWRSMKVGAMSLSGMSTTDLDGDGRTDLLLYDRDKMNVIYNGRRDKQLQKIADYETDLTKGRLFDMVPGDLNTNGKLDILLIEPIQHHLEIVTMVDGDLKRAQRWQVFEEKSFNRRLGRGVEPREAVIGDLDGDGRNDVALLVHDRVLVYLQDVPSAPKAN